MTPTLTITIPGQPVPLERARTVRNRTRSGKMVTRTFTGDRSTAYRHVVQVYAQVAIAGQRWRASKTARYAVTISVTESDRRARDLSNVAKAIEDSLNGIAWGDDAQVDRLEVVREARSKTPGVVVKITEVA